MSSFLQLAAQPLITVQDRGSDPALVAPGFGAFLTFFALALVCVAIGFSMTRRVRRSQYRNAERARAAAEGGPGPDGETAAGTEADPAAEPGDGAEPSDPHRRGA